ncbi:MAG: DUF58 domain-containing protein [Bacteroidetes bacterium]|nr:DUF58 domain-containing protein [Bacteroidota bacterium]
MAKASQIKSDKAQAADSAQSERRKRLRRIEIKTRKLSAQVFSGSYHSAFKGRGISFSEVREYQFGDDIRSIDWNVTARANKPFIKVFEEEREQTLMLIIDVSRSTMFGTQTEFKKEIIEIISGILAFSAITNNDKVGVIFFSDKVEKFIPAKKGKSHIMRIISEIDSFESQERGTDLAEALKYFNNVSKKKAIAFMISDFMVGKDIQKELTIAARKHDFIGIQIYDKRERLMEDVGTVLIQDAESGVEFFADTSDKRLRAQIQKLFDEQQVKNKVTFGKAGAQFVSIDTTANYVTALMKMFKEREIKR